MFVVMLMSVARVAFFGVATWAVPISQLFCSCGLIRVRMVLLWTIVLVIRPTDGIADDARQLGALVDTFFPRIELVTGAGEEIVTESFTFQIPDRSLDPTLSFDFGFATGEEVLPDTFYDSFSVTLQPIEPSATALVLSAVASQVFWAPPNPEGLVIPDEEVQRAEISFGAAGINLETRYAYSVTYELPPELAGGEATLYFDLFDNANEFASFAYVENLVLAHESAHVLALQSSANPAGPYADECEVVVDEATGTMTLPRPGPKRFFRLSSVAETRIREIREEGDHFVMPFEFTDPVLSLEVATAIGSLFAVEPAAVIDLEAGTVVAPVLGEAAFFRLSGNVSVRILTSQLENGILRLTFDFLPSAPRLQSSAQAAGPYADEQSFDLDALEQVIRVPRFGIRFFKLNSSEGLELLEIKLMPDRWVFRYGRPAPVLRLFAAPTVDGAFVEVSGVTIDSTARVITTPVVGDRRFFMIRPTESGSLVGIEIEGANALLSYETY